MVILAGWEEACSLTAIGCGFEGQDVLCARERRRVVAVAERRLGRVRLSYRRDESCRQLRSVEDSHDGYAHQRL